MGTLFTGGGSHGLLDLCFYTNYPALRKANSIVGTVRHGKVSVVRMKVPFDSPLTSKPIVRDTNAGTLGGKVAMGGLFTRLGAVGGRIRLPLILVNCLGPVVRCKVRRFFGDYIRDNIDKAVVPSLPFSSCLGIMGPVTSECSVHIVVVVAPRADRRHVQFVSRRASNFVCVIDSTDVANTRDDFNSTGLTCFGRVGNVGLHGPHVVNFKVDGGRALADTRSGTTNTVVNDGFIALLGRVNGPSRTLSLLFRTLGGWFGLLVL